MSASLASLALALFTAGAGEGPAEGDRAPDFKWRTPTGAVVRLDEIAYGGPEKKRSPKRPLLLDFFRTDCGPCLAAMPELVELHRRYAEKGLEVLLVALLEESDGRAKLDRYLEGAALPFRVVVDDTEHFTKKYLGSTVKLPATFLLDRGGTVRGVKKGGGGSLAQHFGPKIEAALAEKP